MTAVCISTVMRVIGGPTTKAAGLVVNILARAGTTSIEIRTLTRTFAKPTVQVVAMNLGKFKKAGLLGLSCAHYYIGRSIPPVLYCLVDGLFQRGIAFCRIGGFVKAIEIVSLVVQSKLVYLLDGLLSLRHLVYSSNGQRVFVLIISPMIRKQLLCSPWDGNRKEAL